MVQNILIVSCFVVEPSVCRQVQSADHLRFLLAPFAKITSLFTSALFVPSVGVKSAYSPAPSTVYSQPPPLPQRQVTALKTLSPVSPVSSSYTIYPVSTSVQQPQTTISSYSLGSTFSSTAAATSYPGIKKEDDDDGLTISYRISEIRASVIPYLPPFLFLFSEFQA